MGSPNMSYSPSYRGFFNLTMPLFAPRTFRADDYNDPIHLERISTLNMFVTKDLGAIPDGNLGNNYTSDYYRINEWYKKWLPDESFKKRLQDVILCAHPRPRVHYGWLQVHVQAGIRVSIRG